MMVLALALVVITAMGCTVDIFQLASRLRNDIKIVVTDKAIQPMIPEKTMGRLAYADKVYLKAVKVRAETPDSTKAIGLLLACADEVLDILGGLDLEEKYDEPIAAIRIGVRLLRSSIQLE